MAITPGFLIWHVPGGAQGSAPLVNFQELVALLFGDHTLRTGSRSDWNRCSDAWIGNVISPLIYDAQVVILTRYQQARFPSTVLGTRDALMLNIGSVTVFISLQGSGEVNSGLVEKVSQLVLINQEAYREGSQQWAMTPHWRDRQGLCSDSDILAETGHGMLDITRRLETSSGCMKRWARTLRWGGSSERATVYVWISCVCGGRGRRYRLLLWR